jgi:U3 small nucleolar ribonucleoprotein protein LCP5
MLGHSLLDRSPPPQSFASISRHPRGSDAGDIVDSLVESRAVLEKVKTLESRMRYQIDKLVKLAQEAPNATSVMDG